MILLNKLLTYLPFMTEERAELILSSFLPMLEATLLSTIPLTLISFTLGLCIAVSIAIIRTMPSVSLFQRILIQCVKVYVSIIRGTPMLVQIFLIFYGLPEIGITLDPFPTAIIAFSLNIGGYASETIRAGILSVPKGQWEASYAIGMSYYQTFLRTIMPQAIRVSVPSLANTFISTVKDTSLASLVLVTELFRVAQNVASSSYEFILVYSEAAFIYWIICFMLSIIQQRLESHLARHL